MKLITATLRAYLLFTLLAFVVGGAITIVLLKALVVEEIDESLWRDFEKIQETIETEGEMTFGSPTWEREIHFQATPLPASINWKDTVIIGVDDEDDEIEEIPFRQLTVNQTINGHGTQVTLRASLIETDDLIEVVSISLIILFIILLVGLILINRQVLRKIWHPFFQLLESFRSYRVSAQQPKKLPESNIYEFAQLKEAFLSLTQQAETDYNSLKNFTENASHEIQTPLAAAKTDLDMLLQHPHLEDNQKAHLHSLYVSINRLSRLNEGLLLLTKIENRQYLLDEQLALHELLQKSVEHVEEMAALKGIRFEYQATHSLTVKGSKALLEILCDNLLKNALQHSQSGSLISITTDSQSFTVSNPGLPFPKESANVFERFSKMNPTSGSLGLGLAICKQICLLHGLSLTYTYFDAHHHFTIRKA